LKKSSASSGVRSIVWKTVGATLPHLTLTLY
jgi:hypothetical protein